MVHSIHFRMGMFLKGLIGPSSKPEELLEYAVGLGELNLEYEIPEK